MTAAPAPLIWNDRFGLPDFGALRDDDFGPAFDAALTRARAEVAAIVGNSAPPTFANTIAALEAAGADLARVTRLFFVLSGADATPVRQALQRRIGPELAAFRAEMHGDRALFARIEAVEQTRAAAALTQDQARLLVLTQRQFRRAGAALEGAEAARMRAIMARLAELGTTFTQNLLADEAGWHMELAEADLEGMPEPLIAAARSAGRARGLPGPAITLSRSLVEPFLEQSPRRDLRRKVCAAWQARGATGGATDNRAVAAEILALRAERAQLLGYDSFAAWKLETEMAATPRRARDLLMAMWAPAKVRAERDAQALTALLRADGIAGGLAPRDWRYYAAQRRRAEHDLDAAAVQPYLSLDAMLGAAFDCANRLFGLDFRACDLPLYHPDCRAWEVTRAGRHVAVFIGDYFARPTKRSGAWCAALRGQAKWPEAQTPVVLNICNFTAGDPALLSYDEARTLFHEFGHALHHMLSDVTYESLSGTNVARDFVEFPSQLFEHWLEVPEVLQRHARHVETGTAMPVAMLERLLAARRADTGFESVEYLASALVDLAFHDGPPPVDPMARQAAVLAGIGMPPAIAMRHATPHFAHVFAGDGYAAGYYSYVWAEAMAADAFGAFAATADAFDAATARALERHILARGGAEEADALYTAFRGRLPGVAALLAARGLDDHL